jgi:CBS domain-containing protein
MSTTDTPFARTSVADVAHTGILTTDPDTPLALVARLMSDRRVHMVAISETQLRRPVRFVSALDVAAAVASAAGDVMTAGEAGQTELQCIGADESIETAAAMMVKHQTEHLVVIDPGSAHAEGIVSSLDVAALLGR